MQAHLEKGHLEAFGTYKQLTKFVGGKPAPSKIRLLAKARNGIAKARAILDTKEGGVKWITTQTQRVSLPACWMLC